MRERVALTAQQGFIVITRTIVLGEESMGHSGLMPLVTDLLFNCGKPNSSLLATDFYNETWMHRIALQLCGQLGIVGSPMSLAEGASWHSEGRLGSPFLRLPRGMPGGELKNFADGYTKADATLGHFRLWGDGEIRPNADATQFVIGDASRQALLMTRRPTIRQPEQLLAWHICFQLLGADRKLSQRSASTSSRRNCK
jgi:hypothetical protein